ncbi:hypothetical protein B0T10DRAFT_152829 [Thelonectria olida]|uniref:Uncharacterized protein n=1 Tax=Thelonectria olida TaxID=1576542 RepID=A0A9P8VY13_9HYPO|nr:hypothetical protein B0T10DRAFT_152829 [Thelonectria olida]
MAGAGSCLLSLVSWGMAGPLRSNSVFRSSVLSSQLGGACKEIQKRESPLQRPLGLYKRMPSVQCILRAEWWASKQLDHDWIA